MTVAKTEEQGDSENMELLHLAASVMDDSTVGRVA